MSVFTPDFAALEWYDWVLIVLMILFLASWSADLVLISLWAAGIRSIFD